MMKGVLTVSDEGGAKAPPRTRTLPSTSGRTCRSHAPGRLHDSSRLDFSRANDLIYASCVSLRDAISTPPGRRRTSGDLFDTIADHYDLITVLLSYGQDQRWKRRLIDLAGPLEGRIVLDLACGTGDLAFLASRGGARVTGLDITSRMIELAHPRAAARIRIPFRCDFVLAT